MLCCMGREEGGWVGGWVTYASFSMGELLGFLQGAGAFVLLLHCFLLLCELFGFSLHVSYRGIVQLLV